MTCLNATASTAAASRTPIPVLERILLHQGSIVQIAVPLEARKGQIEDEGRTIHFLQFKHYVHGGMVNCFVHAVTAEDLERYYGDTLTAEAKVWQKNLEDGRRFIYVDLLPTTDGATHELFFLYGFGQKAREAIPYSEADWTMFKTPGSLKGAVVLVSRTAMKLEMPELVQTKPVTSVASALPSTGYPTLDRKLAEGWLVDSADEKVVNLYKLDSGGKKRTDKFFKPQPKTKKKNR